MSERTMDTELSELNGLIMMMANMVETSVAMSIEAVKRRDEKMSDKVIEDDKEVDQLELEIDDKCITILATRQPMAADLRFIATAMKIVTDLERIGDLSVDISQRNKELLNWPLLKPLIDTPKLAEIARQMIRESIDSFVKRDGSRSLKIHDLEKESDRLKDLITDELIDIMTKDCSAVPKAIPLVLIARHLERICDHAMNIAEDVVYMVEAKVVKHLHEQGGG
ncbi:MAG: phosphate signaling complex protein PhoU [Candidatus Saganbacteria bacterium]|nr:phosphate signaling complex protein PhoU [Candidatus Saganbacteria bacterium]